MARTELTALQKKVVEFGEKRNWRQFHSPKNIASALSVEAAELLEIFQWMSEQESRQLNKEEKQNAAFELADIFMYTLLMSEALEIDLLQSTVEKIELNEQRFPINEAAIKPHSHNNV